MAWQRRARVAVVVFMVGFAVVVYLSLGQRAAPAGPATVERQDPAASSEIISAMLKSLTGVDEKYKLSFESQLAYPDGSVKMSPIRIEVPNRGGRHFVITASEARSGRDERVLDLMGDVKLEASDGFTLQTATASFNRDDGMARAPGAVTFSRGRMTGSGTGMTYHEPTDVLTITENSTVTMTREDGVVDIEFKAGASTLDRMKNTLQLDGGVHVKRTDEEFDADRATAQLSAEEEHVTFIQLRGNSRVAGGTAVDSMSARDIDLDYTDDGTTLERIVMTGDAAVALPAAENKTGRELFGGTLDLTLAPDGAVTRAIGDQGVRLTLPSSGDAPSRAISALKLDGQGEPGRGLTAVRFDDKVEYAEGAAAEKSREARSRSLRVSLDGDAIADAVFNGQVTFRDGGLEARAAEAGYAPGKGSIRLSGAEDGRLPNVTDEQIVIEAPGIDVDLATRRMTASATAPALVRTTLRPATDEGRARSRPASRLPGLLDTGKPVVITAASLDYGGTAGQVTYTGNAVLRQQGTDTYIKAAQIVVDQEAGNLTATGEAQSRLTDESGESVGTADAIGYDDAQRLIAYTSKAPKLSRLNGPQGDLRAGTIEVTLPPKGSGLARLDAHTMVAIELGVRTITGARLEYNAAAKTYVVYSATGRLVTLADRTAGACQQSSGTKLTFNKSTDNIKMEGEERVSRIGSGGACASAPSSPPAPTR